MTLNEAIIHAEETANEKKKEACNLYDIKNYEKSRECIWCSEEHQQLAEWLKDYKRLLEKTRWTPVTEKLPENDDYYYVTEKSGRVCTYIFHKEGNSEEYWKRCTVAWMPRPEPYKAENEKEEI